MFLPCNLLDSKEYMRCLAYATTIRNQTRDERLVGDGHRFIQLVPAKLGFRFRRAA